MSVPARPAPLFADIDDVGILDSRVISTLIAILREVRARGASVELRASRKSILDTLRITALDKVFAVTESFSTPLPRVAAPRSRIKAAVPSHGRLVASVAAGAFAAASLLGAHGAQAPAKVSHAGASKTDSTPERVRR